MTDKELKIDVSYICDYCGKKMKKRDDLQYSQFYKDCDIMYRRDLDICDQCESGLK